MKRFIQPSRTTASMRTTKNTSLDLQVYLTPLLEQPGFRETGTYWLDNTTNNGMWLGTFANTTKSNSRTGKSDGLVSIGDTRMPARLDGSRERKSWTVLDGSAT